MIGTNTMVLNQATMQKAVQEWLDKRYSEGVDPGPKVTSVWIDPSDPSNFKVALMGRNVNVGQT